MPKFTLRNTVWHPKINCYVMRQFEDQFDVPFTKAGELLNSGRMKPLLTLAFFSIGEQAAKEGLAFADFEKSLETMEQIEEMGAAVGEALQLFIRSGAKAPQKEKAEQLSGPGETSTK